MKSPLSKGKYNLVCVAHPDDETLFFGGLLLHGKRNKRPWAVICTTSDGNESRRKQFKRACRALGVGYDFWWGFPDRYESRLPITDLVKRLRLLPTPHEIYTHGIVGEYGHPHHQDVCCAVHHAFHDHPRLFTAAYNTYPEMQVRLSKKEFSAKARILTKVYGSETSRFLNVLPATFVEGFCRLDLREVNALYDFFAKKKPLQTRMLHANLWLKDYLPHLRDLPRPF